MIYLKKRKSAHLSPVKCGLCSFLNIPQNVIIFRLYGQLLFALIAFLFLLPSVSTAKSLKKSEIIEKYR
jgi:hypothetical protein